MEIIAQLIQFIKELFSWWFIVTPWEQAVFVRAGKHVKVLKEGMYFKIPFVDQVYLQPVRLRTINIPMQTISTSDGRAVTLNALMAYSITDIHKLYNTVSHPDTTLIGIVMSCISDYIRNNEFNSINHTELEKILAKQMEQCDLGLGNLTVHIISWAEVKTFRLIQDQSWVYDDLTMEKQQK